MSSPVASAPFDAAKQNIPPAPQPPANVAGTAILTLIGALTLCALVLIMLAAPDAPFTPQWPWQWAAVCAGVLAVIAVSIGLVWRERQVALCWYGIAVSMQQHAQQTTSPAQEATEKALAEMHELLAAKSQEMVGAVGALADLAESCTTALENQRDVLKDLAASKVALPTVSSPPSGLPSSRVVAYDPLTGAIAHAPFMARLGPDVEFAQQHQRPLALALFDIEDFHAINQQHGYSVGDDVLFAVAERMRSLLDEGDLFARLGADRFAVVWPGMSAQPAQQAVERILQAVSSQPLLIPTNNALRVAETVPVTLRAGLALCPDDGYTAQALLDIALDAIVSRSRHNARRAPHIPSWPYSADVATQSNLPALPATQSPAIEPTARPLTPMSYIDAMTKGNSSIQALTSALEAQDPAGIVHARHLAELAEQTAIIMGRSIEEARLVGLGALLHDVGNLGIPTEILEKPEPLTTEEWSFVRKHPDLGYRLLSSVGGVLAAVAAIVATHRERWDGTGYPAGISGEQIPLGARIVAVCDVYGALISTRPYRPAHTPVEAVAEVRRQAGTQFDPAVVEAFVLALQQTGDEAAA
ncbi:MAG TPA: diguanylate cyclase [Ktedonobacterales bacterium]|nr:diguanylate cyclase [Ktedonobacterales bacterium]